MTNKIRHPFETPDLSSRQIKRRIEPLVRRFQEELRVRTRQELKLSKLPFRYDIKNDMLHLFVASSENTISSPGHKGVYVDYDPVNKRIVGMTFLGFYEKVLPNLENTDDVLKAWRKIWWRLRLLSWVESFVGLVGITFEELERKRVKNAVESWVGWYENNPTKLELAPVAIT